MNNFARLASLSQIAFANESLSFLPEHDIVVVECKDKNLKMILALHNDELLIDTYRRNRDHQELFWSEPFSQTFPFEEVTFDWIADFFMEQKFQSLFQ